VAVVYTDPHFSHKPPISRSVEGSWYGVMEHYITKLSDIAAFHNAPILCCGDLFDYWKSPPELINFLLRTLPVQYAIPGNHDLPLHNYEDIHKSGYWTLVEAGRIKNIAPGQPWCIDNLILYGFPCGFPVKPCIAPAPFDGLIVALVHDFIWTATTGYEGANEGNRLQSWLPKLEGYDAAFFGDNHAGFLANQSLECKIMNVGAFLRRTSKEKDYQPSVGLLYGSGKIERHFLDTEADKFLESKEILSLPNKGADLAALVEELGDLANQAIDFTTALQHFMETRKVGDGARQIINAMLENVKEGASQ
jgi:hypothetical protein